MRKKGILSRVFAGAMAVVLAVTSTEISAPMRVKAADNTPGHYIIDKLTAEQLIQGYGLIASGTISGSAHVNSNFLANKYVETSNCGTQSSSGASYEESYAKEISYNCNPQLATRAGDYLYLGPNYEVVKLNANQISLSGPDANGGNFQNKIMERPLNIVSDTMLKETSPYEAYAIFEGENGITKKLVDYNFSLLDGKAGQDIHFDSAKISDGVIDIGSDSLTVNYKWADFVGYTDADNVFHSGLPSTDGTILFKFSDLSSNGSNKVVVNLDMNGVTDAKFPNIRLTDGTTTTIAQEANFNKNYNRVIFNLYDSSKQSSQYQSTVEIAGVDKYAIGTLISPSAKINLDTNWDGVVVAKDINITAEFHRIGGNSDKSETYTFEPYTGRITVHKVDNSINGGQPLGGAIFGLYSESDCTEAQLVARCETTSSGVGTFYNIVVNTSEPVDYYVKEIMPPKGYHLNENATPVAIKLTSSTKFVEVNEVFVNEPISIKIAKKDADSDSAQYVPEAVLKIERVNTKDDTVSMKGTEVINANGTVIVEDTYIQYKTGSQDVTLNKLPAGTYKLSEVTVPTNYQKANDITFVVDQYGKITVGGNSKDKITMVDLPVGTTPPTTTTFSKKSTVNSAELSGATLKLVNAENGTTDFTTLAYTGGSDVQKAAGHFQWNTAAEAMVITNLPAGAYELTETGAPDGYKKITTTIKFGVDADGNVTLNGTYTNVATAEGKTLTVLDAPIENITISKVKLAGDGVGTEELPDAHLALYEGSYEKTVDKDAVLVDDWDTLPAGSQNATPHVIDGKLLKLNTTYTLVETAKPIGFEMASNIIFTIDGNGNIEDSVKNAYATDWSNRKIVMFDAAIVEIAISKRSLIGSDELDGAVLTIAEADDETKVVATWTSKTSDGAKTIQVKEEGGEGVLKAGTKYVLIESTAPVGYKVADEKIKFTVSKSGEIKVDSIDDTKYTKAEVNGSTLIMKDAPLNNVSVTKVQMTGDGNIAPLADAELKLYKGEYASTVSNTATLIDSWSSTDSAYEISGSLLQAGEKYTLVETGAPTGFDIATNIIFKVNNDGTLTNENMEAYSTSNFDNCSIVMLDNAVNQIKISKKAVSGTSELPNAKLTIKKALDNSEICSWISGETAKDITVKVDGGSNGAYIIEPNVEYLLVEDTAPLGYGVTEETIKFKVDYDGKVSLVTENNQYAEVNATQTELTMRDKPITATFSKKKANGTDELAEATIRLIYNGTAEGVDADYFESIVTKTGGSSFTYDTEDGKPYIQWVSTTTSVELGKLPAGSYTMKETGAPDGYAYATDITFTIDKFGKIKDDANCNGNKVKMVDEAAKNIKIGKYDINTSSEISGATLQILDGNTVICEWISGATPQNVVVVEDAEKAEGKPYTIVAGQTYILKEQQAPDGYTIIPAEAIKFSVSKEGVVTLDSNTEAKYAEVASTSEDKKDILKMKDDKIKDIKISKKEIGGNNEGNVPLAGAELALYLADANGNPTGDAIHSWTSENPDEETISGDKLKVNTKYVLVENAAPAGYKVTSNMVFTIDASGAVQDLGSEAYDSTNRIIIMIDSPIEDIEISKKAILANGPGSEELPNAELIIYKGSVADSNIIEQWNTKNYVDGNNNVIPHVIDGKKFELDTTYILVEKAAPDGYLIASQITFKIKDDGSIECTDTVVYESNTYNVFEGNRKLTVLDAPIKPILISKKEIVGDQEGDEELPGANLTIYKGDYSGTTELPTSQDKIVESWISGYETDESSQKPIAHSIDLTKYKAGETYTLVETAAPGGYNVASCIVFTINNDGSVTCGDTSAYTVDANGVSTITMLDAPISAIFKKVDTDDENLEVSGAVIRLISKNGDNTVFNGVTRVGLGGKEFKTGTVTIDNADKCYFQWTSTETEVVLKNLPAGDYIMHEEGAPQGYKYTADIEFTVDQEGKVYKSGSQTPVANGTLVMKDEAIKATFTKTDVANGPEIPGAKLQLFCDTDGTNPVNATYLDDVVCENGIQIAHLSVNGKPYIEWTSVENKPIELTKLPVGTYRMVETGVPDGHTAYKSEISFVIKADGKAYKTANDQTPITDNKIEMVDEVIKDIQISKKEIVGDKPGSTELPGAKLSLHEGTAAGKNVVEPWIGGTTPKVIDGKLLKVDTTYVIVEEAAPNGYAVTSTVSFKIDEDGKVTEVDTKAYNPQTREVAIFDAPIEAVFSKQDTDKKNVEIPGATIQLIADASDADLTKVTAKLEKSGTAVTLTTGTNASGKKFIQWTSGNEAVKLTKLPAGKYTMSETGAPKGYAYADDITFTITADGKVTGYENNKIVMNDDAIAPLKISKVEIMGSDNKGANELPGAKMTLYKGNGTKGEKICEWISSDKPYEIPAEKFEEGQTYTIHEVSAPKGFRVASDITFTYGKNGTILNATNAYKVDQDQRLIAMLDDSELGGTYSFSKVTLGGKEIYGAKMQVVPLEGQDLSKVEKLNGSGGKDVVITKDSITWVTTAKTLGLVAVPDGKYKLVEVEAPDGYIVADPIEFIAQDGILTDGQSKVELKDLYDPNTTTVSVYSRYYNVETFDPNHEDIIQTNTPTANSTEFELRDENGDKVKVVNKIVTRREIADGVDVTVVTFVIDTTQWEPSPVPRTYTITESKKPTAKEDGGYTADDGEMVTTYTITKDYVTVDGKQVVNYDRVWSNKYQTNVAYDETNPDKIPLYSHTKTLSGNVTEEPQEEKVSFNATVPPEAQQVFPEVKSPKTGEESFPVGLFGGLVSAMLCLGVYNVISYKKKKEN